jgi:hypothetical protein
MARLTGIVIVSVDAAYFVSGYDLSKLGEHGVLSLIGTDGISQVTRTGDTLLSGEKIDYAAANQDPDAIDTDAAVSISSWDSTRRWMSARELYGFPLAVLVGLSVDEQMAAPQKETRTYLTWAALGSALVVVLTTFLGRMSWQLAQGREMFRRMAEAPSNPLHVGSDALLLHVYQCAGSCRIRHFRTRLEETRWVGHRIAPRYESGDS